jgi:hypothetical protein
MILEAADYAEHPQVSSPPPDLRRMLLCRQFPGQLPEAGAIADQPAGLLGRMRYLEWVYQTMRSFHASKSWQTWMNDNPDGWKLKLEIDKLRKQHAR